MLSDFQKRKLAHLFQFNDVDGDGALTPADLEQAMQNLAREFQVDAASDTFTQLRAMFAAQWQQIQTHADPNRDGRVSPEEWLMYWDAVLNTPGAMEMLVNGYNQAFHALFALVDPTGPHDAFNAERWSKYFAAYNQSRQAGMDAIQRIDRNRSGLVDTTEAQRATTEFFGDDADAPGNFLFGPY